MYRAELDANLDLNPALAELMFARHLMNKLESHVFALKEEDAMKAQEFAAAHQVSFGVGTCVMMRGCCWVVRWVGAEETRLCCVCHSSFPLNLERPRVFLSTVYPPSFCAISHPNRLYVCNPTLSHASVLRT